MGWPCSPRTRSTTSHCDQEQHMTVHDQTTAVAEAKPEGSVLTDGAPSKVRGLLDQEGRDDLQLRVAVQPGGCSGLRYQLFFDERSLDRDLESDFRDAG